MRRTHIQDYKKINEAKDLDKVVKDKRQAKRANKRKAIRRNRRYENKLLRHLTHSINNEEEE